MKRIVALLVAVGGLIISFETSAFADDGADFAATTTDNLISSTAPDTLVSVTTDGLSERHTHICVVTASAEATYAANGVWVFGLSLDGAAPTAVADRRIEMIDNAKINDDTHEEVSTTTGFSGLAGDHTFTFSARKTSSDQGNLNVTTSSMTVVCTKTDL